MDNTSKKEPSVIKRLLALMKDTRLFPPGHDICLRCAEDLGDKDPATGQSPSRNGHICNRRKS